MIIMFGVPLYHHHSNRCAHHEYQQVSCALCGWPMFLWISITTFPIIPIIIIIIITRPRPAFGRLGLGGLSRGYSSNG